MRIRMRAASVLFTVLVPVHGAVPPSPDFATERIIIVSDLHGEHLAFRQLLSELGMLSGSRWGGGQAHLVVAGDMVDRGSGSRDILDLLIELEQQAHENGGRVHVLLGNHEVMNLVGDLRYVAPGEFAAFAPDEPARVREAAFKDLRTRREGSGALPMPRSVFDQRYPPGYFAHRRAFGAAGKYGRWLSDKPFVAVVNGTAIAHAGVSGMDRASMARSRRPNGAAALRRYLRAMQVLTDAGVFIATDVFADHVPITKAYLAKPVLEDRAVSAAARDILELQNAEPLSPDGPVWYRGDASCRELIGAASVQEALHVLGATRLVIGHTPTATGLVTVRRGGRVINIDTGAGSGRADRALGALELTASGIAARYMGVSGAQPPIAEAWPVGRIAPFASPGDALQWLVQGRVIRFDRAPDGSAVVELERAGATSRARFWPARKGRAVAPVAAYRLDKLLGLDMVLPAVEREIDGQMGALQLAPAGLVTEIARVEGGRGGGAWCPLPMQFHGMYLLDALMGTPARDENSLLYRPDNWQLFLAGPPVGFGRSRRWPAYLQGRDLTPDGPWRERLASLDLAMLEDHLGDLLDRRQLAAILARRDRLLELAPH